MTPDRSLLPCEGSYTQVHFLHRYADGRASYGLCSMCGVEVDAFDDGNAVRHDRVDVLAMIEQGDFDD